jgi:mannose-6-phosphate isomerase class I
LAESYQNYRIQKQSKYSGFLIHEIQQNSDTTYRVFDWNRLGLDGKPRQLHVEQSMASIDFNDFESAMDVPPATTSRPANTSRRTGNRSSQEK